MRYKILPALLVLLLIAIPSGTVRADVAPPANPPGSNVGPDTDVTQVRMVAETVVLDVRDDGGLGVAQVTADFTMRNLGTTNERMAVRFPVSSNDGWGGYPEIRDVKVFVDGQPAATRRILQADPVWGSDDVPWVEFDVSFPPAQDVNLRVTYQLAGTGEYPFVAFKYILHTGAGWRDSIGTADLIVRLPYEANLYNVIISDEIGWSTTTPNGILSGREIRWQFTDFEPEETSDDFAVSLIAPAAWQKVLTEQGKVQVDPQDGEAWGRLAKAYKEILFYRRGYRLDAGGADLYALSIAAYEKAVALKPNDALWHAGFADLLAVHAYYEYMGSNSPEPDKLRAMQEIDRALQLAPRDPKVKEIAEKIYNFFNDVVLQSGNSPSGYVFYWLTATPVESEPTPFPTLAATSTPTPAPASPTGTAVPAADTPVPTSQPAPPTARNPFCGGLFLLAPLVLVKFTRRRGKHAL